MVAGPGFEPVLRHFQAATNLARTAALADWEDVVLEARLLSDKKAVLPR
jgi:hypothetical protein